MKPLFVKPVVLAPLSAKFTAPEGYGFKSMTTEEVHNSIRVFLYSKAGKKFRFRFMFRKVKGVCCSIGRGLAPKQWIRREKKAHWHPLSCQKKKPFSSLLLSTLVKVDENDDISESEEITSNVHKEKSSTIAVKISAVQASPTIDDEPECYGQFKVPVDTSETQKQTILDVLELLCDADIEEKPLHEECLHEDDCECLVCAKL